MKYFTFQIFYISCQASEIQQNLCLLYNEDYPINKRLNLLWKQFAQTMSIIKLYFYNPIGNQVF